MSLGVAVCIFLSAMFTLFGCVFDLYDRRWALVDVWLITTGASVSALFIIFQLFGIR